MFVEFKGVCINRNRKREREGGGGEGGGREGDRQTDR